MLSRPGRASALLPVWKRYAHIVVLLRNVQRHRNDASAILGSVSHDLVPLMLFGDNTMNQNWLTI